MRRALESLVRFLGSFGLCTVILGLLLLLTYFGTLEQKFASIYDVQKKYFESLVLTRVQLSASGPIPMLLPGGYALLTLLAVNLVVGGLVRLRKSALTLGVGAGSVVLLCAILPHLGPGAMFAVCGLVIAALLVLTGRVWPGKDWSRLGVLITHGGILVLLAAGLVEFHFSTKGVLALSEQDLGPAYRRSGDEFEAYFEWDVIVAEHLEEEGGTVLERVLPFERFEDLGVGESARFEDPGLPFDLRLSGFQRNCVVLEAREGGVDGLALRGLPPDPAKAEHNSPGMLVTLVEKKAGGRSQRALLHGLQSYPWRVSLDVGGAERVFDLDLRRRRWAVPFTLQLDEFTAAYYPGTNRPKEYSSRVTKLEEGSSQPILISMNQPLRHKGYTFFQSDFQRPQLRDTADGRRVRTPWVSVFSVVKNPADSWPLTACGIIFVGLSVVMLRKLGGYVKAERRRRAS